MLQGYGYSLLQGFAVTVALAFGSLAVAMLLGLAGATAKLSRSRVLRGIATAYTTVIRGVPDLVLMLLVFFGGQLLVNEIAQRLGHDDFVDIDPFIAGVLTIGFIFGAYLSESFRGAFLAVSVGQREAGLALGLRPHRVFLRIVAPQMLRHALPSLSNNWLVMVKSTAIVSVIGLNDMLFKAGQAAGSTRQPFLFYAAAAIGYLVITSFSEWGFSWLQRRTSRGVAAGRL